MLDHKNAFKVTIQKKSKIIHDLEKCLVSIATPPTTTWQLFLFINFFCVNKKSFLFYFGF